MAEDLRILSLPIGLDGGAVIIGITFDESVREIRLQYTRENRTVVVPMGVLIAEDETLPAEERFQHAEFLMLKYTALVMKLRPELEPKQPIVVRDLPDSVKRVIEEATKLRGTLEHSLPTSSRGLFRALNAVQAIDGCDLCGGQRERHVGYCAGPGICTCCKQLAKNPTNYYGEIHCASCADWRESNS